MLLEDEYSLKCSFHVSPYGSLRIGQTGEVTSRFGEREWHLLIVPWKEFTSNFMGHFFLLFQEAWLLIYFFKISCFDLASYIYIFKLLCFLGDGDSDKYEKKAFCHRKGKEENRCLSDTVSTSHLATNLSPARGMWPVYPGSSVNPRIHGEPSKEADRAG